MNYDETLSTILLYVLITYPINLLNPWQIYKTKTKNKLELW